MDHAADGGHVSTMYCGHGKCHHSSRRAIAKLMLTAKFAAGAGRTERPNTQKVCRFPTRSEKETSCRGKPTVPLHLRRGKWLRSWTGALHGALAQQGWHEYNARPLPLWQRVLAEAV